MSARWRAVQSRKIFCALPLLQASATNSAFLVCVRQCHGHGNFKHTTSAQGCVIPATMPAKQVEHGRRGFFVVQVQCKNHYRALLVESKGTESRLHLFPLGRIIYNP